MSDAFETLFDAVRRACSPALWSRGVELCRAEAVVADGADDDEVCFRIRTRGGMISPRVTLFPGDAEWDCECGASVCEHAAAAVITWRRAREEGTDLAAVQSALGRVGYRFGRVGQKLTLERVIVREEGAEEPLEATLAALASGRVEGPRFVASQADLAVELALGTHRRGVLPPPVVERLFRRLAGCSDLRLDGHPIHVSGEPLWPRAVVEDQGEGFRLYVAPAPGIDEVFDNGVARCGEVLRPAVTAPLTGRERHELVAGKHFPAEAAAELVTEVLPSLARRLTLDVRTKRLPSTAAEPPRVQIEVEREGHELSVLATLVYGDPPRGRIDGGRLVHLGGTVPLRDERSERRLVRRLGTDLGLAPGIRERFAGEDAVSFAARLGRWEHGGVRGRGLAAFRLAPALEPRLEIDGELFDVRFETTAPGGGSGRAEASAVLRAWRAGASLVPLLEGGWAPLPHDWLERHGRRVADLLAARGDDERLPRGAVPDLVDLCEELDLTVAPDLSRLRDALRSSERIPPADLPGDLATPLRGYQQSGVDWLVLLRDAGCGALLADDMGLGKTLQALCAVRGRTLVVCPTSVLHNWVDEIRRHRPGLRHALYHGPARALDPAADVTITSYALLRLDADRLAAERWDSVVLDEAQTIKNPDSQVAAAAYRMTADFRLALTGTPVENRLEELWSQFHFTNPGLLGGRTDFRDDYADPIAGGDGEIAARLRERIRPFLLRRLKADVAAELPPRTDMVLWCELDAAEREVYDAVRAATVPEVVRRLEAGGGVMAALEALLRLRQACCHPSLLPGQSAERSSKLDVLREALDSVLAEGHRALIFSQWTSFLDLVEPELRSAGVEPLRLDGSTQDRAGVVRRFQDPAGPPVMLVSLKAGGIGLNLTAADHVFLLDPWWNPAVEDQAADRAHRIGQERPVMVYRLVAADTVEERILALQERKRELASAALEEGGAVTSLGRDELLELLE